MPGTGIGTLGHVVVTGAGRGIGATIASRLASRGWIVSCIDIDADSVAETTRRIGEAGGRAHMITADLTDPESVDRALGEALRPGIPIDGVVANAGGAAGERVPFLELSIDRWDQMISRNLGSAFLTGLVFGRHLAHRRRGSIVFTGSTSAEVVLPGLAHYCAAKGGAKQLMRAMALELAPFGVRVNSVAPGVTLTPGNASVFNQPEIRDSTLAEIPLGRFGQPEDLVGAVAYFLSDDSAYTTGATILIDGGMTLH